MVACEADNLPCDECADQLIPLIMPDEAAMEELDMDIMSACDLTGKTRELYADFCTRRRSL